MTTAKERKAAEAALFAIEMADHKRRVPVLANQAPVRERGLVSWLLDFANPPAEPDAADERDVIARRVEGWLAEIYSNRTHPDRLKRLRGKYFAAWASEARHVDVVPVFELTDDGRIREVNVVVGGRQSPMLARALLVLLTDERGHLDDLGRCKVCRRFFLLPPRLGAGRPERGYCSPEHKDHFRKEDQRERKKRSRAKARKQK